MAKRASTSIKIINLTEDELSYWSQFVFRYYRDNGKDQNKSDDKLKKFILSTLQECMNGWERCPRKLEHRIGSKFDIPPAIIQKKNATSLKVEENVKRRGRPIKSELSHSNVLDLLSPKEKEFWEAKKAKYIKDYELNGVSDIILVDQCIIEEINLNRLNTDLLKSSGKLEIEDSKLMKESIERIQSMHRSLGILKEQRNSAMNDLDGNVAVAAREYDEKKELIKEIEAIELAEEVEAAKKKAEAVPLNEIPDIEKLRAIVGDSKKYAEGESLPDETGQTD